MKHKHAIVFCLSLLICANLAMAQDPKKIELGVFGGRTGSEGIEVEATAIGGGQVVDQLDPKSGSSWGFDVNYLASENWAVGFQWTRQSSKLLGQLVGGGSQEFGDLNLDNYHGTFTYHFGGADSKVRPYFFGGLGSTVYGFGDIGGFEVDGATRFSTTWGGGVKFFFTPSFGVKAGVRWTPTYIKSDPEGIWCSPYYPWSCWVVGDADYSQQAELSAGIVIRF